jgi:hypothetical protein
MKAIFYQATLADGVTPYGNYFDSAVTTPGGKDRTTVRTISEINKIDNEFKVIDNAYILYNSKVIPVNANHQTESGVSKQYRVQTFTIYIDDDYIQCTRHDINDSIITFNVSKAEFMVISTSGRFKKVKRVVIDYDNYNGYANGNTENPAPWNLAPEMVFSRRVKFYSS